MQIALYIAGAAVLAAVVAAGWIVIRFFPLWLQAKASAVPVGLTDLFMMRLRQVDPDLVVNVAVALSKAGLAMDERDLEAHVLSGGNLAATAEALISAHKAGLPVDFRKIAAIDLAGRNVRAAVANRVNPKVLVCPSRETGLTVISGVCQDGVRLGVRARITVRTHLDRLIGGAGEDTVVARVGEGIVAAIGRARAHSDILQQPERISDYLLRHGLDSGTCFEILSVDIADVDVLDNVGARLQAARADADKKIAQAQAEIRRATAVAAQREMQAETLKSVANVVAAQAYLPLASAAAFQEANLGRPCGWASLSHPRMRWLWRTV